MIVFLVLSLLCEAGLLYFLIIKWFKYEQELIDESKVKNQRKKTAKSTTNKKTKSKNNKSVTSKKNVSKKPKNTKRAASSA